MKTLENSMKETPVKPSGTENTIILESVPIGYLETQKFFFANFLVSCYFFLNCQNIQDK